MVPDVAALDPDLKVLLAANLKLENERLTIALNSERRTEGKILAEGENNGQFEFIGIVAEQSVHMLMNRLESWSKRNPGQPIQILLNSGGGSVVDGLAFVDYLKLLRKRGHHITITGVGLVASMASAILMAADERVLTSRCYLGLHEVSSMVQGSVTIQEDHIKFSKALQERIVELLCERSNLTPKKLKNRWERKDVYVNAKEALEMGLVDRIEEVD